MVLWEITLATAYFLGLKRTYILALKIQRLLISPKRPRIRKFVQGRTRAVFDVALKVHQNIQHRDIEVGRNLGNWILRWLDRMKPSAQIRGTNTASTGNANSNIKKQLTDSYTQKTADRFERINPKIGNRESDRHLFTSSRNVWAKPFPTIAMMMRPTKPAGTNIQYRQLFTGGSETLGLNYGRVGFDGVIRKGHNAVDEAKLVAGNLYLSMCLSVVEIIKF